MSSGIKKKKKKIKRKEKKQLQEKNRRSRNMLIKEEEKSKKIPQFTKCEYGLHLLTSRFQPMIFFKNTSCGVMQSLSPGFNT